VTNAPYGICRCDSTGEVRDANPALLTMLGYSSASELVGRHLGGLYVDTQQWFDLADYLRSTAVFNGVSAEWQRKDGSTVGVRVSGRSVADGDRGRVFELFAEDVTERRALEQQLRQSQKMEAVGRLAGGIAHDFNNLLMVISGYSEFLLEHVGPDPTLRNPTQEIASAAERASSLTRQLLAFSRKQMMVPKVLDLNVVVTENLKMLTRMIGEDIDLVMIPASNLGAVKADAGQIEQVIMNLAVNARDAMPSGGKLTIETASVTLDEDYARFHAPLKPGEYIMLAISDTGEGMDAETQSHLFEPFFTTKGLKGTGLGLSTVYGIVKQSGGYIWVYSEPGKGTAFKIYLPRVAEPSESAAVVATSRKTPQAEGGKETILLVEDEDNLRRLARQYLEKQGYNVVDAADGAMALQIAVARRRRSLAAHRCRHARDEWPGTGSTDDGDTPQRESVVHVGVHGKRDSPQRHTGCGRKPAPEALQPSRPERQSARSARFSPNPPGGCNVHPKRSDQARGARKGAFSPFPRATIPTPLAFAIPPARRRELARGHNRKHQPLRLALRSRRIAAAQRTVGNQPCVASRNCRPLTDGSCLSR